MKKVWAITSFMMLVIINCFAEERKAAIKFDNTSYDFGTFAEEKGKVTTEFKFSNTGNAPLLITRTAASCGCTTPEYPKEPIAPGKSGIIKVTYNAKGRPGVFQKTVYVFTNTDPEKSVLIIKGHVNAAPPKKEDNFPKEIGDLRLKSKYMPFFDVYPGKQRQEIIDVYNPGKNKLHITFSNVPKHLKVEARPSYIAPNGDGKIVITYIPGKAKDWGLRKDQFKVNVKGSKKSATDNTIIISADIREDFSKLSDMERAKAPAIVIPNRSLNFGSISRKTEKSIDILNNGKSNLIIRTVKNENPAYQFTMSKNPIQPGETAKLKVTCDTDKAQHRNMTNHITVISNDPKNPTMTLRLQAEIN